MRGEAKEVSLAVASPVEPLQDLQNLHDKALTVHKGTCSEAPSLAASLQPALPCPSGSGELPDMCSSLSPAAGAVWTTTMLLSKDGTSKKVPPMCIIVKR